MFLGECQSSTGVLHVGKVLKIFLKNPFLWIIFALGFYIKKKKNPTKLFNKAVKMQATSSLKPLYMHTHPHTLTVVFPWQRGCVRTHTVGCETSISWVGVPLKV